MCVGKPPPVTLESVLSSPQSIVILAYSFKGNTNVKSELVSSQVEIKYEQVPHEGLLTFDKLDPLLKPEGSEEILETHHPLKS